MLLGWGDQRRSREAKQGCERDNCCSVSNDPESVGMGVMQTTGVQEQESYVRTAIPSSPVAYALIQYSRFQFSHFFKIC